MPLGSASAEHLRNWRFRSAEAALTDITLPWERETIEALADMYGDLPVFEGSHHQALVVRAALVGLGAVDPADFLEE